MVKLSKCLGIDLGATSVKIAQLERTAAGVAVTKLGWAALDEGADVAATVRAVIKQSGFSAKHAVFSLYGHRVFLRELSIPRANDDRVRRIVMYEAKQQVPFPFEEASMDYQVFDTGEVGELRVLLGAVKKSDAAEVMKIADRCGLSPVGITVSSVALFNFYAFESVTLKQFTEEIGTRKSATTKAKAAGGGFSFGKKNKAAAVAAAVLEDDANNPDASFDDLMSERVMCHVNIGASSVDMVISRYTRELHRLGFPRTVPEGASMVNKLLERQFGITPEQAEAVKVQQGMVLSAGSEDADMEGKNAEVCQTITKWAERLAINLRKTCDYYMSLPDGAPIDEVVVSGGCTGMLNFTTFLEEKLGLPVVAKTQVTGSSIAYKPVDPVTSFVESIGLALDGLDYGRVKIDFLPADVKSLRDFSRHKIEAILVAASLAAVIGLSAVVGTEQTTARRLWTNANTTKVNTIRQVKAQLGEAQKGRDDLRDKLGKAVGGLQDRLYWLDFMTYLSNATPSDITVTDVEMFADGHATVTFKTASREARNQFENALAKGKEWVSGNPSSSEDATSFNASSANATEKTYVMQVPLKHKTTRLAKARETLLPGLLAPTETPAPAQGFGGGGMMGMMGGPGGMAMP